MIILTVISLFLPFFLAAVPVVLSMLFIFGDKQRRSRLAAVPGSLFILAFLPVISLAAVLNRNWIGLMVGSLIWIMFMYGVYMRSVMNSRLFKDIQLVIISLSIVSALIAITQKLLNRSTRSTSTFFNPNYYGFMIELFMLVAVFYLFTYKKHKHLVISAIILNLAGLFLSNCRTAWIGLIAGVLLLLILSKKYKFTLLLLALGALVAGCAIFFPEIMPRWNASSVNHAADQRELMWWISSKSAMQSPIIGRGLYAYTQIWNSNLVGYKTVHCHNLFLNSFLDTGIIGTLLWLGYIIMHPISVYIRKRRGLGEQIEGSSRLILPILLTCLCHCMTDIPVLGVQPLIMLFVLLSCAGSGSFKKQEVRSKR
jgi:O-antigen ligase